MEVVVRGPAPGGGLYVPERLPALELEHIAALALLPYPERVATIFGAFAVDVPPERLAALSSCAFGSNFDHPAVAPVVPVGGFHVLELWHGPTSAFKDMALQCMPLFFSEALERWRAADPAAPDHLILVATSGDTGKAALEGFAGRPRTGVIVFYPADGVSDLQRRQMVTQRGANVGVFGVRGNFDDCQAAVKWAFNDEAFGQELMTRRGVRLSSANTINWGRLLPQIVYYASAYADLVAVGQLGLGESLDVCVPTGNFGNILAAYYAKGIGVPLGRLICASNENHVLSDFIATGIYDIADRPFVVTPSPSMDILVSSNLERLLYELGRDPVAIRRWMDDLAQHRRFAVDDHTLSDLHRHFCGDYVTNDESLATIERVYRDRGYLLDPHTAVAWRVAERLRGPDPLLVVSTAHWAKFGADVYRALQGLPSGAPLPGEVAGLSGVGLLHRVLEAAPGQAIPAGLAHLDREPVRFTETIGGDGRAVEEAVSRWLATVSLGTAEGASA